MLLGERPMAIDHPGWIYETRFEGWRVLAEFGDGACELRTKSNGNATRWFPEITQSLARIEGGPHVADGVLCVFDEHGHSDAGRMQARGTQRRWVEGNDSTIYCVFDLLVVNGRDIRLLPLIE
jgi:bifunctional non-homologous end joining protein LigD